MNANDSGMDVTNGGNECDMFHTVDFALAPHSWAHMFKVGLTLWASAKFTDRRICCVAVVLPF